MPSEDMHRLGEVVERERERWNVPGISVGVLRDGEVEAAGYGVTSLEADQTVTSETLFEIGSNSKVFTTTLLMTLVDEGKVDLDASPAEYLPELRVPDLAALPKMKMRHLVSHQTGIFGDYFEDFGWGDDALARSVAEIHTLPQMYQPGEWWSYTNINFNIVGLIIERLTGRTFEAAMQERVFGPLKLERTFYFPWDAFAYPHSVGHTAVKPGAEEVEPAHAYWLSRALGPAGSILSNVHDVLAFDQYHLTGETPTGRPILSDAVRAAMQQPQIKAAGFADEWGLGWWLAKIDGVQTIGHSGGTNGFITRNIVVPARNTAFAIFTNSGRGGAAIRGIEDWIFEHVTGIRRTDPALIELPTAQLGRLAGSYRNRNSQTTVTVEDGGLQVQSQSISIAKPDDPPVVQPPVGVKPIGELEFMATTGEYEGMRIDFITNPDGSIRFLRMGGRMAQRE